MVTTPHSTEIRFTYRIAPVLQRWQVYHLQNIRVCNTWKYSFETPFLDYLDFVRQIFRQVGVPYRTSIFNCWSYPRYKNANQIDLIDSSTCQLTTQIMLNFYKAVIESVVTFSITVWLGSLDQMLSCSPEIKLSQNCPLHRWLHTTCGAFQPEHQ